MTDHAVFDDVDRRILEMLQEDGRISNAEVARRIGMAPSAILERIRKLERRDIIRGYEARLDPRALGYGLVAFVNITAATMGRAGDILEELSAIQEVQEAHLVVGEDCFLVKIRVPDTDALADLLQEKIQSRDWVDSTRTTIVLKTAKESLRVPVEDAPALDSV